MSEPLLQVRGLSISLRGAAHVVDGLDLSIAAGARLGLVGESGCGKSLTACALIGLPPRGARVRAEQLQFGDRKLLKLGSGGWRGLRGREIALLPQNGGQALNPVRRVGDQIITVLRRLRGLSKPAAQQRGLDWFARLGLADAERCWRAFPHELSGGQNSRVLLAMALACKPKLLIADEPTAALDTVTQTQVMAALQHAQRETGIALLLISHDLGLVANCVDELAVMYAGQIVETGPAATLLTSPRHPYTQALLASRIGAQTPGERAAALPGLPPPAGQRPGGCAFHPRCRQRLARCHDRIPEALAVDGQMLRCHLAALPLG